MVSAQLSGMKCIPSVVQLVLLSISKTFSSLPPCKFVTGRLESMPHPLEVFLDHSAVLVEHLVEAGSQLRFQRNTGKRKYGFVVFYDGFC